MAFFTSAISTLQTLVVALGAGLGVWGVINLLEGYGNDNPGANPTRRQNAPTKRPEEPAASGSSGQKRIHHLLWPCQVWEAAQ